MLPAKCKWLHFSWATLYSDCKTWSRPTVISVGTGYSLHERRARCLSCRASPCSVNCSSSTTPVTSYRNPHWRNAGTRWSHRYVSISLFHCFHAITFELTNCVRDATQYASATCKLTISLHLFVRWHLFRHVGYLRHQQQVDLWPFDLETGARVTCDVGYLCADFSLPIGLSVLELGPIYNATDVRQTSDKSIA